MKKIFVSFILFFSVGSMLLFAQTPKLSIGGGTFFTNYIGGGGFADIAFLVYSKDALDIRNNFVFRGAGLTDDLGGFFSLPEKISIGGLSENKFRGYGYNEHFSIYFEAGALMYILDNKWKNGGVFQIGWRNYF